MSLLFVDNKIHETVFMICDEAPGILVFYETIVLKNRRTYDKWKKKIEMHEKAPSVQPLNNFDKLDRIDIESKSYKSILQVSIIFRSRDIPWKSYFDNHS